MSWKIKMATQQRLLTSLFLGERSYLAANLAVLAAGEVFSRAVMAVALIHLARVLSPSVYGQVEITLSVMMLLTVIVDAGLGTYGTKEVARQPKGIGQLVGNVISIQILLSAAVIAVLALVVVFLPIDRVLKFLLLGEGISLLGYPFILNWVFQGWKLMVWVTIPQIIRQTVFAGIVLFTIQHSDHALRIPIAEISGVAIAVILNLILFSAYTGNLPRIKLHLESSHRLINESIPIGGSMMIWALRMYLPLVLIGVIANEASAGFFAVGHRVVMVLQAMLVVYFTNLFPLMSQAAKHSSERLSQLIQRSLRLMIWPTIGLSLLTTVAAPVLIHAIYGETYLRSESVRSFSILIWIIPLLMWRGHGRNALINLGLQRQELKYSLIAITGLVVLLIPLVVLFGAIGAALAMIFSEFLGALLTWWTLIPYLPSLSLSKLIFSLPSISLLQTRGETSE